ncbi:MAG: hypothetical protein IKV76_04120 [Clostridia bacterium]|nr:hypothetical protein [Clostridia bacterium]
MKRNPVYSVIAFVLAAVILLTAQIVMPDRVASVPEDEAVGLEGNYSDTLYLSTDIKEEESTDIVYSDNDYESSDKLPGDDTSIKPDDVLPDIDNSGDVDFDVNEEKEGVKIIPVKINNSIRDSLASLISENVYTFTIDERGVIIYGFNHTMSESKDCMWYISLYEEYSPDGTGKTTAFREIERVSYSSVGSACKSPAVGVSPGNYRVVVRCISGFTADKYDIAIGFAATSGYEMEPNNSVTRYTQMSLDVTMNGSASTYANDESDVDWYMFRITEKGYAVLYFEHEADEAGQSNAVSSVAWRIRITDMEGKEYYYMTSGMDAASLNSGIMGLSPGFYFVTVYSHVYSGVTYALNVSFTKDSAIETEFNDSTEAATPVSVNTEIVGSLTARNDKSDRDYYAFEMENDGFVVLDFIHEALAEEQDGWHITVMDENGNIAYSSVSRWNDAIHHSPNIGLTAGKYYILIDSDNIYHNSIVYRLILLSVQDGSWETEPNNIPSAADTLAFGKAVNGALIATGVDYDKDYFSVRTEAAGTLQVSFNHIRRDDADKEGWVISVIDSQGNIIAQQTSDWNSEEIVFTANVEAGTYFILVETGLFFNSDRYILTALFG